MFIVNTVKTAVKNPAYRSVGIYIFTNFFSKGVSFILIPLFTNPLYLTPTDNGLLSLFSSNMILLAPLISLGMIQSSTADFYRKSKEDFSAALTTNFFIAAIMALLASTLLFIFKDVLAKRFDFPPSFVYILPFLVFLVFASEQLFSLMRNRDEVNRYAVVGISKSLIEYTLSVILVVFFFTGWTGRIWGITASLLVVNLFSVWYYVKNKYVNFSFHRHQVWDELKFGVPIFVFQLCVFMLGASNKLFLAIFNVNKYELGIYSIACILGSMVGTVAQSILLYVQPQLYRSLSTGEATVESVKHDFFRYLKLLTYFSLACIAVVVFAYYFLINKLYLSGLYYFFIVALASFIWALNYFLFLFLLYYKRKKTILNVSLISIICSVIVNVIFVKNFLILGDALSGLIDTILFSGIIITVVRKIIKTSLDNETQKNTAPPHEKWGNENSLRTLAPIVFFAYNRPLHTRQTLEALSKNRLASESSLYIFIDAPKSNAGEQTIENIKEVKKIVAEKKWCKEVHIITAETNKGLLHSIIDGITSTVNEFGKVIVLEDDVLVSPGFLEYMNDALDFYEHTNKVMHISGYSRADLQPAAITEPTYFFYHTSCWGWATWKRAWDKFDPDPGAIKKALNAKGNIRKLNMDGTFEFFWGLNAVAGGKFQSWNTIWHSVVFLNDGLSLHPKQSMVTNIGHDGSGVNCEPDEEFGKNAILADHVPVTEIPLVEHEAARSLYRAQYSFKYRFSFNARHYLRYIFR